MEQIKIKLNRAGIRELLRSPGVQADLRRRGNAVASAAGPGHRVDSEVGRNRARCEVVTESFEAMAREARDRNLTRAFGHAR
jgi:hypothetical protein